MASYRVQRFFDKGSAALLKIAVFFAAVGCTGNKLSVSPAASAISLQQSILVTYNSSLVTLNLIGLATGSVITPLTPILFFNDATCSGAILGQGIEQDYASVGIQIVLPSTTISHVYVRASTETGCQFLTDYQPVYSAPAAPVYSHMEPTSPSRTNSMPYIFGSASGNTAIQVFLYSDSSCHSIVGSGTASAFSGAGIRLNLPTNQTTKIYSRTREPFGAVSQCTLLTSYTHNPNAPPAPSLLTITPTSPNNFSTTPAVIGLVDTSITNVLIYGDAGCTTPLVSGPAAAFTNADSGGGLVVPVTANASTTLWIEGQNANGDLSPCSLLTVFINDTIPPSAPQFSNTVPQSPTNATIHPLIQGTNSSADTALIKFYNDSLCSVQIGSGAKATFEGAGIQLSVGFNTPTTVYGRAFDFAGNGSLGCTLLTTFINNSIPPSDPIFVSVFPASPNNQSSTPMISGTASPEVVSINFYSDALCSNSIGSGPIGNFVGAGIQVTVPANSNINIYAHSVDAEGNLSTNCLMMTNYANSNIVPAPPIFVSTAPSSPSRLSILPNMIGTVGATIASVQFFSDPGCGNALVYPTGGNAGGTAAAYTVGGIPIPALANQTISIYAQATDVYGNPSACVFQTNYTHDNIPPVDPVPVSITPISPNNISATPSIKATVSADTQLFNLYDDSTCANAIGTGSNAQVSGVGITATVPPNITTSIYARAFDLAGNGSNCVSMFNYLYDSLKPGTPNFVSASPATPSYVQNTNIIGTISASADMEPIASISLYSNASCGSGYLLATDTVANFTTTGIPIVAHNDSTTSIYGQTKNAVGTVSNCNLFLPYVHSDYGPGSDPLATSHVTAQVQANGSIYVSWPSDPNATSYTVKRSIASGGPYAIVEPFGFSTSFTDKWVGGGQPYYYVVTASNLTGTSNNSTPEAVTTVNTTNGAVFPSIPIGLVAIPSNQSVSLSWTADSTQMSFNVKRSTQSGGPYTLIKSLASTGAGTNTYADNAVNNGTTYYYVVTAQNPLGLSLASSEVVAVPVAMPSAPTNVVGRYVPGTGFIITWTSPSYYNGSQFWAKKGSSSMSLSPVTSVPGDTHNWTDISPTMGSVNYYSIGAQWGSSSQTSDSAVIGFNAVAGPTVLASSGNNEVVLSWPNVAGAVGYRIWRATTPGGPYAFLTWTSNTVYPDSTIVNGSGWYYVVDTDYGNNMFSETSLEVNAAPAPNPSNGPSNLIIVSNNFQPRLSWSAPAMYSYFKVYRATTLAGVYLPVSSCSQVTATTCQDNIVSQGTYFYKVAAYWGDYQIPTFSNIQEYRYGYPAVVTPAGTATQISLTWTAVPSAVSYNVQRSVTSGGPYSIVATPVSNSLNPDSTALLNQGYFYVISANFSDGTVGQNSNEAKVMAGSSPIPSGLTVLAEAASSVQLTWVPVLGATGYKVRYSTNSGAEASGSFLSVPNTNPITVSGLAAGKVYYFIVTAIVGGVESAYSSEVSAQTNAIPAAPIVLAGDNSVTVQCPACSSAYSYTLLRSTDKLTFTQVQTDLTMMQVISGVSDSTVNGTTYYYEILPIFLGVTKNFPSPMSAGVTPGVTPPAPAGLAVISSLAPSVSLGWTSVTGATNYILSWGTANGGPYPYSMTVSAPTTTALATAGINSGVAYYFVVQAYNGSTALISGNSAQAKAVPTSAPAAPLAVLSAPTTITLSWSVFNCGVGNASSYDIYRSTNQYLFTLIQSSWGSTSYPDSTALAGTSYNYEYQPHCASSVLGAMSTASSSVITPGVAPLIPQGVLATTQSSSVNLSWIAVPTYNVTYNVYRGTSSGGPYGTKVSSLSSANYFQDTGSSGKLYYVVTAVNDSGVESGYSAEVSGNVGLAAPVLAASSGPGSVNLTWNAVAGATTYTLRKGLSGSGPFGVVASGLASISYTDPQLVPGSIYYYVVTANASGVASPYSNVISGTPTSNINLQVPIEMTDQSMASDVSAILFERTRTSLDSSAYDGTPTYFFEVVALNTGSINSVAIVNAAGVTLGSISVSPNSAPTRLRSAPFNPDVGMGNYRLKLGPSAVQGQLQILSARILVNQVGASKTKIYIPLLASSAAPSSADLLAPIESTNSTNYVFLNPSTIYQRITTGLATLSPYNTWQLETLMATTGGATGAVVLYDISSAGTVDDTETLVASGPIVLTQTPVSDGVNNFASGNENDQYQIGLACQAGCSGGQVSLYKAGLWVTLINLTKAEVLYRNALSATTSTAQVVDLERSKIDLSVFSNPVVSFSANAASPFSGIASITLQTDGTADYGSVGLTNVAGSSLAYNTSGVFSVMRSGPITISSGDRFVTHINPVGGIANLNSSFIVIDVSQ
jgi:fibronectin type 3 domain-containing protein